MKFLSSKRFGLVRDCPTDTDTPAGNLVLFAYDWRLSNRWTAKLLKCRVERALARWQAASPDHADAKVIFICHSMGGLIARWYLDRDGGAEITRALITLGTPHRGALKALNELVNGVRKGRGAFAVDLTSFARSLPSTYQLLPEYACIEGHGDGRLKTTECELPELDRARVIDGMSFHDELDGAAPRIYTLLPVVGIGQPTWTTAKIVGERVEPSNEIAGRDLAGDGTVPRLAARPKGLGEWDPSIRGVGEGHGSLAVHQSVLDQVEFVITAEEASFRAADGLREDDSEARVLGVSVEEVHELGEPVAVAVHASERRVLEVIAIDENGREVSSELVRFGADLDQSGRSLGAASFQSLDAGGYTIVARAPDDRRGLTVPPVRATTLVWRSDA